MEWFKVLKSVVAGLVLVGFLGLCTGCESSLEKFRKEGVTE